MAEQFIEYEFHGFFCNWWENNRLESSCLMAIFKENHRQYLKSRKKRIHKAMKSWTQNMWSKIKQHSKDSICMISFSLTTRPPNPTFSSWYDSPSLKNGHWHEQKESCFCSISHILKSGNLDSESQYYFSVVMVLLFKCSNVSWRLQFLA